MFILILGLGRTGKYLSQLLLASGHQVAGTTRSEAKAKEFQADGIIPYRWSASDGTSALPTADIVVCAFPPTETYSIQLAALGVRYPNTPIIQISSTSVFGDQQELVNEASPTHGKSLLIEAENEVLALAEGRVIRAGGLYDEENHPVKFVAGKKDLTDGPVNLIHREDLAEIIKEMIDGSIKGKVIHAVNPQHPKKSEYYKRKALDRGLEVPEFKTLTTNKIVTTALTRQWRSL